MVSAKYLVTIDGVDIVPGYEPVFSSPIMILIQSSFCFLFAFPDDKYYRYNTMSYRIDNGYPQPLSRWNNVAHPISSVLDWEDNTYFFTGQYYQIFFNSQFSAASPAPTAQAWLGCETEGLRVGTTMSPTDDDDDDDNTGLSNVPSLFVIFVTSVLGTWLHISS